MSSGLIWERDGQDWPNRSSSRFVDAGSLRWHVQTAGSGPAVLLIHGTGASTHSWRGLFPLLTPHFTVIAPDLPGHGFTGTPSEPLSLPFMARATGELLRAVDITDTALCIGHSAGAAILLRMALDGITAPRAVISLNGALMPFRGAASQFFSPIAKLLFLNPYVPRLFAWRAAGNGAVDRLIEGTGSRLDAEGIALYSRLFRSPAHCAGALGMMANWDLEPLVRDLPRLKTSLVLVAASNDRAVQAENAFATRDLVPGSTVEYLRGLGHLAHEEDPGLVAALILRIAREKSLI